MEGPVADLFGVVEDALDVAVVAPLDADLMSQRRCLEEADIPQGARCGGERSLRPRRGGEPRRRHGVRGARGLAANAPDLNHNHAADQALPAAGANAPLTGAAAYVFHQGADGGWVQRAAVSAPNASRVAFDSFFALAISADTGTVVLATGEPAADAAQGMTRSLFVY